ncbi:MAG: hypothetical protein K5746_02340 [Clostridiales bacterium]|nr:hypothetical protein [Clostridiales bacterium]
MFDLEHALPAHYLRLRIVQGLRQDGIGYENTKVGDKYVYEDMGKTGNRLGGEQSGRSIFLEYETTDDGILTILKLMEVMLAVEKSLS